MGRFVQKHFNDTDVLWFRRSTGIPEVDTEVMPWDLPRIVRVPVVDPAPFWVRVKLRLSKLLFRRRH